MTGVRTDDGKTLVQCVIQPPAAIDGARGRAYAAVDAAVGLVEKAAVPRSGQAHLETDSVFFAIHRAHAVKHIAGDPAVRRDVLACDFERARSDRHSGGDAGVGEVDAARQVGAGLECAWGGRGQLRQARLVRAPTPSQQRRRHDRQGPQGGGVRRKSRCGAGIHSWDVHAVVSIFSRRKNPRSAASTR